MKTKRKKRMNPVKADNTSYWLALGAVVVGGVAIWAWRQMTPAQQATALK